MELLEIIHFTVTQNPVPIRTINPAVPEQLEQIISLMLSKNKQERVQVCTQSLLPCSN